MGRFDIFVIIMVTAGIGVNIFGIWALVEFILYLAKDNPFNWNSLYWTVGAFSIMIVVWLISFLSIYKDK